VLGTRWRRWLLHELRKLRAVHQRRLDELGCLGSADYRFRVEAVVRSAMGRENETGCGDGIMLFLALLGLILVLIVAFAFLWPEDADGSTTERLNPIPGVLATAGDSLIGGIGSGTLDGRFLLSMATGPLVKATRELCPDLVGSVRGCLIASNVSRLTSLRGLTRLRGDTVGYLNLGTGKGDWGVAQTAASTEQQHQRQAAKQLPSLAHFIPLSMKGVYA
jgi:hypothetical protein